MFTWPAKKSEVAAGAAGRDETVGGSVRCPAPRSDTPAQPRRNEIAHAKAAFVAMGTDEVTVDATFVVDHLKRERLTEFTVRDLHVKLGTNRFPKVDDLKAALDLLEDHHWIRRLPEPEHSGLGRKPSPAYVTQFTQSTETLNQAHSVRSVDSVTGAAER
jgi:hypothetical protein